LDVSPVGKAIQSTAKSLKPAPNAIIGEAIQAVYDATNAAGEKPPNIRELPAAVMPLLEKKGYSASARLIQELGGDPRFKDRRRPPGKTVSSERSRQR
jgi:hypothetical protein